MSQLNYHALYLSLFIIAVSDMYSIWLILATTGSLAIFISCIHIYMLTGADSLAEEPCMGQVC